jgi:cell pole-organizing protein PopZ
MSQPAKLQEPTMEEILASIRRIIADDDSVRPAPAPAKPAVAPAPAPAADDRNDDGGAPGGFGNPQTPGMAANDVFERGDAAQSMPPAISSSATASDDMFDDAQDYEAQDDDAQELEKRVESTRPTPPAPAVPAADPRAPREAALLSPRATAAVDLAFNTLAHTVLVQNSRTLEDLVREMLKPMLKAWLDDNLPNMVERLVRAEIERVSRGRG